ncbi:hypothetical protein CLU83_4618 [Flavobacterium sp. 1]|nr:hypothetical protein CLU83_4618 [Flavobacterium sp. 1]
MWSKWLMNFHFRLIIFHNQIEEEGGSAFFQYIGNESILFHELYNWRIIVIKIS